MLWISLVLPTSEGKNLKGLKNTLIDDFTLVLQLVKRLVKKIELVAIPVLLQGMSNFWL